VGHGTTANAKPRTSNPRIPPSTFSGEASTALPDHPQRDAVRSEQVRSDIGFKHVPLGWSRNAAATRDRAARMFTSKGWNGTIRLSPPTGVGDRVSQGSCAVDPGYRATW
jgi:hypothetical protein